jgi:hypothetical protein
MVCDQSRRRGEPHIQPRLNLCAAEERTAAQVIERRRAGAVDAPLLLAHGHHARPRQFRGSKVDVAQFGERVADGVVDGAFADLPAFDVRHWNAQRRGHRRGRQHLVAVRNEQQQVGTHPARQSARPRVATPMVLAMPTSLSELSRHSIRASIGNPSFSISPPCSRIPAIDGIQRDDFQIHAGCAASSRRGQ